MLRRHFLEAALTPQYDVLITYQSDQQIKFFGGLASTVILNDYEGGVLINIVLDTFADGIGMWGIKFEQNDKTVIGHTVVYVEPDTLEPTYVGSASQVTNGNVLVYDASTIMVDKIVFIGTFYPTYLINFLGPIKENIVEIALPKELIKLGDGAFRDMFKLSVLKYDGTIDQWNNLEKAEDWYENSLLTEVQCSNGTVTLQ